MNANYLEKVKTIDAIVNANYECLCGEPGEPRNWDLYRYLFHPEGKLIRYEKDFTDGILRPQFLSADDYINGIGHWIETKRKTGFYENEAHKVVDVFGNIAQVFSTYQSFHTKDDVEPYTRGINGFQLLYHEDRWWILSLFWQRETDEFPIPEKYLRS